MRARLRRAAGFIWRLVLWPLRTLTRLTPDGALFLGLALVCWLVSFLSNTWQNIPLLVSMVLISLWLLALWQGTRSLKRIQFRRHCPERMFANDPLTVSVVLTNPSRLPAAGVLVTEELEPEVAPEIAPAPATGARAPARVPVARGSTFVTVVAGKEHERSTYGLTIRRRGVYTFSDTTLETVFPLGFFHTKSVRRSPGRIVVYPRLGEVDTAFFKELELSLQLIRRARPSRAEEDFRSLREYREGDNPKWIHWRSTARLQKMLVKEFEEPQAKRVLLLIDTNLQRLATQRFAAFELTLSFAGTVARDLLRRGCEVQCIALQPKRVARAIVSRERRNMDSLLEMLAGLRRDDARTLADLREFVPRNSLRNAYVLVLGLGSLRTKSNFTWLQGADNAVRIFDARSEEFRQVFRRTGPYSVREDYSDEDVLLGMGDEESGDEDVAALAAAKS